MTKYSKKPRDRMERAVNRVLVELEKLSQLSKYDFTEADLDKVRFAIGHSSNCALYALESRRDQEQPFTLDGVK